MTTAPLATNPAVLDLIGNTPLVRVTRFDTGVCALVLEARVSGIQGGSDQGPHRCVDDRIGPSAGRAL